MLVAGFGEADLANGFANNDCGPAWIGLDQFSALRGVLAGRMDNGGRMWTSLILLRIRRATDANGGMLAMLCGKQPIKRPATSGPNRFLGAQNARICLPADLPEATQRLAQNGGYARVREDGLTPRYRHGDGRIGLYEYTRLPGTADARTCRWAGALRWQNSSNGGRQMCSSW